MRISDWSSDVCSSDLTALGSLDFMESIDCYRNETTRFADFILPQTGSLEHEDRKSVVEGKSVSVRVDLGGSRIIKKKKNTYNSIRRNTLINKNHYTPHKNEHM